MGSIPTGTKLHNNLGQVVHTYVPLSASSITWYRLKDGDVLWLGRWLPAWWKVMAAYRQGWLTTSPVGWLPVHRDQLWAQRLVTNMEELYLFTFIQLTRFTCSNQQPYCQLAIWGHNKSSEDNTRWKKNSDGMLTGMMLKSMFPVCLLYLIIRSIFVDAEHLVIVFSLALLQLPLGLLQQLTVLWRHIILIIIIGCNTSNIS